MSSALDICNLALNRIGQPSIDDKVDPPNLTGEDEASQACNLLYEPKRDALLEMYPWRFAMHMIYLDHEGQILNITAATQADPVVITAPGHTFRAYKNVIIEEVIGMSDLNGNTYRIANPDETAGTFELEDVDSTGYDAYTSGGTVRLRPPFKYEYEYQMPSDYLRDWKLYGTESPYEIKSRGLLIDDSEIYLEYIAQITDATLFDPSFVMCLGLYMAIDLSLRIADSKTLTQQVGKEFQATILDAIRLNAIKGSPPDDEPDSSWQKAGRS